MTIDNNTPYGLYADDIRRIERDLRRLEHMSLGGGVKSPPPTAHDNQQHGFWAKITGPTSSGYKYSWEHVIFSDPDAGTKPFQLYQYQSGRTGNMFGYQYNDSDNHFAVEALTLSSWIPIGSYVWMHKPPYQPYFTFDYGTRTCAFKTVTPIPAYNVNGDQKLGHIDDAKLQKLSNDTYSDDTESTKNIRLYSRSGQQIASNKIVYATFTYPDGYWVIHSQICT